MAQSCVVCEESAVVKCPGCGKALYCGEEHRKDDVSAHKAVCRPYRVETNSKYGRYLVVCRDVKQGELLLRERPVVVGPRVDSLPACLECLTLLCPPVSRCPVCGVTPLCPRCSHNLPECRFYSALSPDLKSLCLRAGTQHVLPLKVLLLCNTDPHYKQILDMEAHLEARRGTSVWVSHQRNVVDLLQMIGAISMSEEDAELVQRICGALDVNSFEVRGAMGLAGTGMRLRGVYVEAALMAHDCVTNVHLSVDDHFVMTIRASVDIPAGQPVLYNYTDPLQTTWERQKHLREGKYFSCSCRRCTDPSELGTYMGGVRCPRCRQGLVVGGQCESCGRSYPPGLAALTTALARDRLEAMDRTDPAQMEAALRTLAFTFPASHSVMVDVKQSVVAAYRELQPSRERLTRKVDLCRDLLPLLRIIEPGISRLRGITLYELHTGLVMLSQEHGETAGLREAEEVLKEAVSLLLYEPTESPEGELAKQAMAELRCLKNMIAKQEKKKKKTKPNKK